MRIKRYDEQFKRAAVELAKYKPAKEVWRELGISRSSLYEWIADYKHSEAKKVAPDIAAALLEMIEQHINDELEFWSNFQAVCKGMPPQAGGGTASEGQGKGVRQ